MVGARVHRCCCEEAYKVQGTFHPFPFLRSWLTTFLYPVSTAGFLQICTIDTWQVNRSGTNVCHGSISI